MSEQALVAADALLKKLSEGQADMRGMIAKLVMQRDAARQMFVRTKAYLNATGQHPSRAEYDLHNPEAHALAVRLYGPDDAARLGLR